MDKFSAKIIVEFEFVCQNINAAIIASITRCNGDDFIFYFVLLNSSLQKITNRYAGVSKGNNIVLKESRLHTSIVREVSCNCAIRLRILVIIPHVKCQGH